MAALKPLLIPAPASAPVSQHGLTIALFLSEGSQASAFWSSDYAKEWALHPLGVPASMSEVMPLGMMDEEETFLYMSASRGSLEIKAARRPGGILAWFQSTPEKVVVGLGLHRFTLVFDPQSGAPPHLKADTYRGGSLGWQPNTEPGMAVTLLS